MAGYLTNSLYAPQTPTFMRAFPNDTDAIVYFTYSPLNNVNLIKKVHVSLVNQKTNENALSDITGVLIYDATGTEGSNSVGYDTNTGMYYVIIPKNALRGSAVWSINQFYKVQLRLDCTEGGVYGDEKSKTTYLQDNMLNFSEWSTVCLIRPILQPTIELRNFISADDNYVPAFVHGVVPLSGQVFFGNGRQGETETLQSYTIEILERDSQNLVYTSGNIYTGDLLNPNDINYKLNLQGINISDTRNFILRMTITTKNQYVMSHDYKFDIADYVEMSDFHPIGVNDDPENTELTVTVNEEEGIASFRFQNQVAVFGTLYIKRSSSISNFTDWESIYEGKVSDTLDMTISDNTIGSHIWYRYSLQLENSSGAMSNVYYTNKFFPQFYEAFLTRQNTQLDLRYDFKVSSMKPVVNRAKIDTLGGRYPRFAENAILNYKQFSISGVISAEGDYNQLFLSKRQYYGEEYDNYRVYVSQNDIHELVRNDSKDWIDDRGNYLTTTEDDWFWEREFREEAIKWLNDGEPKLFRSMTEGLLPVMLTDISLTPKAQLNRKLYDFTATMYEIADGHSLDTLDALGIIDIPRVEQQMGEGGQTPSGGGGQPSPEYRTVTTVGQVYEISPTDRNNMITSGQIYHQMMDRYSAGGVYGEREAFDPYIKNVRIYFHNEPHMFLMSSNNNIQEVITPTTTQLQQQQVRLGYTFQLQTSDSAGWNTIFVNERGYYQIPDHLNVTGLSFNQISDPGSGAEGDRVTVDYIIVFKERASESSIISGQSVDRTLVGQYQGVFKPNQYLGELIRAKYNYITEFYSQRMQFWRGICIDVTPYAVVEITYKQLNNPQTYVVGATGVLHMMQNFQVQDMRFLGKSMVRQPIERQKYLAEHEFCEDDAEYASTKEVSHPYENTVYNIGGQKQIYYHSVWAPFIVNDDGTGIAAVNVEGAINFLGDVVQISN